MPAHHDNRLEAEINQAAAAFRSVASTARWDSPVLLDKLDRYIALLRKGQRTTEADKFEGYKKRIAATTELIKAHTTKISALPQLDAEHEQTAQASVALADSLLVVPERVQIRIGELFVRAGILTPEQLDDQLGLARGLGIPLGRTLVHSGMLTSYELLSVVQVQSLLLDQVLSLESALQVINHIRGGALLDGALAKAGVQEYQFGSCKFGELLVAAGLINERQLLTALSSCFESMRPLGQTLVVNNVLTPDTVFAALAMQRRVREGELTREQCIRELKKLRAEDGAGQK